MKKYWIIVGLIFLLLVTFVTANSCLYLWAKVINQDSFEASGLKLVFINEGGCDELYLLNEGTNTASNLKFKLFVNGIDYSDSILTWDKNIAAGAKIPIVIKALSSDSAHYAAFVDLKESFELEVQSGEAKTVAALKVMKREGTNFGLMSVALFLILLILLIIFYILYKFNKKKAIKYYTYSKVLLLLLIIFVCLAILIIAIASTAS